MTTYGTTPSFSTPEQAEAWMDYVDGLAREIYHQKSNARFDLTDDKWERVKTRFPASARICRQEAIDQIAEEEGLI